MAAAQQSQAVTAPSDYRRSPHTPTNRGRCARCMADLPRNAMLCGRMGRRRGLIFVAVINIITSILCLLWLFVVHQTPLPPVLGFSWSTQLRTMLLPESAVSCGHSFYLLHGAVHYIPLAILVSILAQAMVVMGSIAFSVFFTLGLPFMPFYIIIFAWIYLLIRFYILGVSLAYFVELQEANLAEDMKFVEKEWNA